MAAPMEVTVAVIVTMPPVRAIVAVVGTIDGSIISVSVVGIAAVVAVAMMMAIDGAQDQCRRDAPPPIPQPHPRWASARLAEPNATVSIRAAVATTVVRVRALIASSVVMAARCGPY